MITPSIGFLERELSSRLPAMLRDLETLVSIESPTNDKAGLGRAQGFLASRLEWAGADVEWHHQVDTGDHLVARWRGEDRADDRQVLRRPHRYRLAGR